MPTAELSLEFQPQCGKVQAEVPKCILTCPWEGSQGYSAYLPHVYALL